MFPNLQRLFSPRSIDARLQTEAIPAEIAPLVDSFNHALERLERGYRLQQEFLGHAAHELKNATGTDPRAG